MRPRSRARDAVAVALYEFEIHLRSAEQTGISMRKENKAHAALERQISRRPEYFIDIPYARKLLGCIQEYRGKVIEAVNEHARDWQWNGMDIMTQNVLLIGGSEILYIDKIDAPVAINEAINLAKRYCNSQVPKFVNGILHQLGKPSLRSLVRQRFQR